MSSASSVSDGGRINDLEGAWNRIRELREITRYHSEVLDLVQGEAASQQRVLDERAKHVVTFQWLVPILGGAAAIIVGAVWIIVWLLVDRSEARVNASQVETRVAVERIEERQTKLYDLLLEERKGPRPEAPR